VQVGGRFAAGDPLPLHHLVVYRNAHSTHNARPMHAVLRHMARIGDFREAFLSPDLVTAYGTEDGIGFIR